LRPRIRCWQKVPPASGSFRPRDPAGRTSSTAKTNTHHIPLLRPLLYVTRRGVCARSWSGWHMSRTTRLGRLRPTPAVKPQRWRGIHARPLVPSIKGHFWKISSTFGDKCPQNCSKYGSVAPRTGLGCPHKGPSVVNLSDAFLEDSLEVLERHVERHHRAHLFNLKKSIFQPGSVLNSDRLFP